MKLVTTEVFDAYWRFAAERLSMYMKRLHTSRGPWTKDPILGAYRFTNTYRAADRVSQYLIREVQYRADRSVLIEDTFFRTLLFKIFNKIETWELIERELGAIEWRDADLEAIESALDKALGRGERIYSAAYIMPAPSFGKTRKHSNHLALLKSMMDCGLPRKIADARSLKDAYESILACPGLGPFLSYQYTIDLNYSTVLNFDEDDFVVAGPGALDGISKCFERSKRVSAEEVIFEMVQAQDANFARLQLEFGGLFGRKLKAIDCQNVFCEISKYARVAFPSVPGISGRTRIKQSYGQARKGLESPYFPPKWALQLPTITVAQEAPREHLQKALF